MPEALKEEIEAAKRLVNTDLVQITIGEVSAMYSARELNILPEFQRLFRWSKKKKSDFIESILIGIPIPPVFAYENDDGTWELIDGLQRISTVLEFMGLLRDVGKYGEDLNQDKEPKLYESSVLAETKYLKSLNNVTWESRDHEKEIEGFDKSLQLFFRRARIEFQILKHPSDSQTKFDLFQRLNRGGEYATAQEIRSCSMVLTNAGFMKKIRKAAISENFKKLFRITETQEENQMDVEYVVRWLVHTYYDYNPDYDVEEFLNRYIIELMQEEDIEETISMVEWGIDLLIQARGLDALIPPDGVPEEIAKRFSLRALETIAVGLTRNFEAIQALDNPTEFTREKLANFWNQSEVASMSVAGQRGTTRIQRTVPFGEDWFRPNVAN